MGTQIVKVVIDTNVIVSALLFGGTPGKLVTLWQQGIIKPFFSRDIVEEIIRVLAYPKFRLTETEIQFLLRHVLLPYFDVVTDVPKTSAVPADPSDDMFVNCAAAAGADMIISGDRHLLDLKAVGAIRILSPTQFLEKGHFNV